MNQRIREWLTSVLFEQALTLHAKMKETITEVGTLSEQTAFHVVENQGAYTTITVPSTPWLHPHGASLGSSIG